MHWIGVGVPSWPRPSTSWDWWAWLGVLIVFTVLRWVGGVRLGVPLLVAAVIGGALFGSVVHAAGTIPALMLASALALAARRLRRPTSPPSPP